MIMNRYYNYDNPAVEALCVQRVYQSSLTTTNTSTNTNANTDITQESQNDANLCLCQRGSRSPLTERRQS